MYYFDSKTYQQFALPIKFQDMDTVISLLLWQLQNIEHNIQRYNMEIPLSSIHVLMNMSDYIIINL